MEPPALPDSPSDPLLQALHTLASRAGLIVHWEDAQGRAREVEPEVLRALLSEFGLPSATVGQCEAARAHLAAEDSAQDLSPLITADQDKSVPIPTVHNLSRQAYRLELEEGSVVNGMAERDTDGNLCVPAVAASGYHRLLLGDAEVTLAVAPARCFGVEDALLDLPRKDRDACRKRPWGLSLQLYSLRRGAPAGLGDLTALAQCCEAAGRAGADAVAINPLHAGFAAMPQRYSPYAPSSRLFLNPLYGDPATAFGQRAVDQAIEALGPPATLPALEARTEIDWIALAHARNAVLHWLWERRSALLPAGAAQAFAAFRRNQGAALEAHARFEALQSHHLSAAATPAEAAAAADWRHWPVTQHSPQSAAVEAFARANVDAVSYHAFVQWLAADGLAAAQRAARGAGMAIGLVADLAVGTEAGGSHAWARQDEILPGVCAGAPPDLYNPRGQSWGVSVFSPRALRRRGFGAFIETLRANLGHVGGLRIDHALGLARMWLVPDGAPPTAGAYLRYPFDDLLRLIALESWRHRAIMVGENLGTVPASFNASLAARGMLGIDVLWFEREHTAADSADATAHAAGKQPATAPAFLPPEQWPAEAVATTTTHDLPTVAGWWAGRDIVWRARLDQLGAEETESGALAARARDRSALWQALSTAGLVSGAEPGPDQAPLEAVLTWLGRARTPLRLVPVEDLLGIGEQPNLPGTVSGHPNWQRRLDADVRTLFGDSPVRQRIAALVRAGETDKESDSEAPTCPHPGKPKERR
ncbi:4-alpha-glucanotransferase [Cupriavidus basilensis]|uniref:4-alpha-glucanotransferase n=1 Tax=Cupriavidus basilensis TaxID=68895 RepID=A0A643FYR1_9BURK|nr:4-alpha-glucanotransferase [Cupriavidus basilensis]QOT81902.1 4-alpha-glucanotransferase [Cupriavidus basilensis]